MFTSQVVAQAYFTVLVLSTRTSYGITISSDAMETSSASPTSILESSIIHVSLPPRLPGRQEYRLYEIEHALAERLLDASRTLRDVTTDQFGMEWDCVRCILETCKVVNAGGRLNRASLLSAFRGLHGKELLILHVVEQNAGLLLRPWQDVQGKSILIEAFEASPLSDEVLASKRALKWDFPGCAVAIPVADFNDPSFQDQLATFLEQASKEAIKRFAARTTKAGRFVPEGRDSVDPSLITQMLMTLLEVNGTRAFPSLLRKRVRDDVCWRDGAEKPWRRSPFWLVLRVGIQRHLCAVLGGEVGRLQYKFLMCVVVSRLLDESFHLGPEMLACLKMKLCRRLVKLEVDKERAPIKLRSVYEYMFRALGPSFRKSTHTATERLEAGWTKFKNTIQRPVYPLPWRADQRHLNLTLPNSGSYLQSVLRQPFHRRNELRPLVPCKPPNDYDVSAAAKKQSNSFASRYFKLAEIERDLEHSCVPIPGSNNSCNARCLESAGMIESYMNTAAGAYESNPEQKSIMILTIMELWMSMDESATKVFGLLRDYNPAFPTDILDVLQLPRFHDMCRLQRIRVYLQDRHTACKNLQMNIFNDPVNGCFAERFYNDSPQLQDLHRRIEEGAKAARVRKEEEWQKLTSEYEELVKTIAESTCIYYMDEFQVKTHDDRQCNRCFLERRAKRFRIKAHEHPLPSDPVQAKSVVFELACPNAFVAYRDATWRILGTLASPAQVEGLEPRVHLRDYSELKRHSNQMKARFSLASTTKSFLVTHYSHPCFPVGLDDVCLPNGLKFGYFDTLLKVWPGRQRQKLRATFAHHCQSIIPAHSPFSSFNFSADFAVDGNGPSSYEVVASQSKCPSGLNVHEYMAYQSLYSGYSRRWPQILIELGSTNLNFSTEATTILMSVLALQVGPPHKTDPLGTVHRIFQDELFSTRLMDQISRRLDGISSNWRETCCMETMITLILRLCSLAVGVSDEAIKLLERARAITFKWVKLLRLEIQTAKDASTSQRCSQYVFWAALLCKRTFAINSEDNVDLEPEALSCFIECSITAQENLVASPSTLPPLLRKALVRDLSMVFQLRFILRRSLEANPQSLMSSISSVWPDVEGGPLKTFSRFRFLPEGNEWWAEMIVDASQDTLEQPIHFHLLEGHLFVMGQPVGKLPAEYLGAVILEQLFGNQSLLTYPSNLPGMNYMLAISMYGHQIHLGFRNGNLVIRARFQDTVLELIPRERFGSPLNFDLPAALVENRIHWLDLKTGIIEIRRQPNIWKPKESNWRLDVNNRQAWRRTVRLVDPNSPLFQRVARMFDGFELRHHLTVFQPEVRKLTVELHRLELSFTVNRRSLLESEQLRSEIDPDQDAGTWFGLRSKIVLRDVLRPQALEVRSQRSIIVPLGIVTYRLNGPHVTVDIENGGNYGRFTINDVLGRLDCPAEERLLYLKAQLHAYTSFLLPDALTGRTGTEEALHCLKSGYCQPWTPLTIGPNVSLMAIAQLTPRREYYPEDLKVMQKTFWDPHLTTTIQHDGLRDAVEAIRTKSEQLSLFATKKVELPQLGPAGDCHLTQRSRLRREAQYPPNLSFDEKEALPDLQYIARDRFRESIGRMNVLECASIIRNWHSSLSTTPDLAGILQSWPTIGGCTGSFNKILLSDLLDLEIALEWGSLVNLCRTSNSKDKYRLMFMFSIISFRHDAKSSALMVLIAFCVLDDLKAIIPPNWASYIQFRQNQIPRIDYLMQLVRPCLIPYGGDDRSSFQFKLSFKQRRKFEAAEMAHEQQQENDSRILIQFLLKQWPCAELTMEGFDKPVLVDISKALEIIRPEWQRLVQNLELSQYVSQVQLVLDQHRAETKFELLNTEIKEQTVFQTRFRGGEFPTLSKNLLAKSGPALSRPFKSGPVYANKLNDLNLIVSGAHNTSRVIDRVQPGASIELTVPLLSREFHELQSIINGFIASKSAIRQQYGSDLLQSLTALRISSNFSEGDGKSIDPGRLRTEIYKARLAIREQFDRLCKAFERDDPRAEWLLQGGLWPSITPVTLLENLRSTSTPEFGKGMKESLIVYALSLTALQRLIRMEDAYQKGNNQRLIEEQENTGHSNWNPVDNCDWLLLEIHANILIRPSQVEVTLATVSPSSGSNSVLQMNMGQGKTSCIMPMAAAVLADGKSLLRLVVPKPLLLQTAQLLHARLGGLVGREIRHVPFSRKTSTKSEIIESFYNIHRDIQMVRGVMVDLPEHQLSFKLSGLQKLSDGRIPEACTMIKIQSWMTRVSRTILDECDYTLALRTQLIYPSGSQKTVDGNPHRWQVAETLLRMVDGHLWNLQKGFPHSIEVIRRQQGGFPFVFFLRKDVEDELISRLVDDIFRGRTSILPGDCTKSDRLAIKQYISDSKISAELAHHVIQMFPDKPASKQTMHLLRGLLVHRILLMTLKKRWNVQYGLHPGRDPISVPYMAKGTPSDQAEWGHPDVAILFTCLSFYYDGLKVIQLRQSLEHVLKSDDPSQVYDRMSQNSNLPDSLREWNAINVDDEAQLKEIWQHVRYNVVVIDYFLNNFVFPKHAKQFHMKLQASGWDIPHFSPANQSSRGVDTLTTGFSGTNDWKRMLPLTISQQDLPGLAHTNAEVLTYLLQARSRQYVLAADARGKHLSELDLLRKISSKKIRILIDAGAQILEMDNFHLAKAWLDMVHAAPAAVFFNADSKPWVLYRQGHQIPLLASPFADDLGGCLVYLDQAHTRGTDLKMPQHAVGALTLGLGQTKDHTVQGLYMTLSSNLSDKLNSIFLFKIVFKLKLMVTAAMRLRQLATTQAVVFFAPPEVNQSILDLQHKKCGDHIDSYDVIFWLLEQTCSGIEQLQPLHFSQGADFCRRAQAALDNPEFLVEPDQRESYLGCLRQVEQQTLEQLYGVSRKVKSVTTLCRFSPKIAEFMKELYSRRKRFQDTGNAVHGSALQEVEQEREISYEVEKVREVQKPVHYSAFSFPGLHRDIVSFAKTGRIAAGLAGYEQAFMALRRTAVGRKYGVSSEATSCRLYVSAEFSRTVSLPMGRLYDNFQRHVNWILWSPVSETAVIVIPEEAEHLLSLLRETPTSPTHLLTYAAPVTRNMLHFNDLKYYAVPSLPTNWEAPTWLRIELGIFAGRLYFEYSEYEDLCDYLGVPKAGANLEERSEDLVEPDTISGTTGIIDHAADEVDTDIAVEKSHAFTKMPLIFLQEWLDVRRKGQDFAHTPMGYVCLGKHLLESHPFFMRSQNVSAQKDDSGHMRRVGTAVASVVEEDAEVEEEFFDDNLHTDDVGLDEKDTFDDAQLIDEEEHHSDV